jgi:hypothetical protein
MAASLDCDSERRKAANGSGGMASWQVWRTSSDMRCSTVEAGHDAVELDELFGLQLLAVDRALGGERDVGVEARHAVGPGRVAAASSRRRDRW